MLQDRVAVSLARQDREEIEQGVLPGWPVLLVLFAEVAIVFEQREESFFAGSLHAAAP